MYTVGINEPLTLEVHTDYRSLYSLLVKLPHRVEPFVLEVNLMKLSYVLALLTLYLHAINVVVRVV